MFQALVVAILICSTAILEWGDGGLNFSVCYRGMEGMMSALEQLQRFVLLVSKLLL